MKIKHWIFCLLFMKDLWYARWNKKVSVPKKVN